MEKLSMVELVIDKQLEIKNIQWYFLAFFIKWRSVEIIIS